VKKNKKENKSNFWFLQKNI